jgi:hypothetical protein
VLGHAGKTFEASGAEEGLLARAIRSRVNSSLELTGWWKSNEVLLEVIDLFQIFEADDGESGAGEAVLRAF